MRNQKLSVFASQRFQDVAKVAIVIVADALLFCVWFLVAWGVDQLAVLSKHYDFSDLSAMAFKWISSIGTLFIASFSVAKHVVAEAYDFANVLAGAQGDEEN